MCNIAQMMRHSQLVPAVILCLTGVARAAPLIPPKVVSSSPDNAEIGVDPRLNEIRIEFDQPMDSRGRSIVGGGETFPQISGDPKWLNDTTFVIPVTLKLGHDYQLSMNSDTFKGFTNIHGEPAEWYPIGFHTRSAHAGASASDVTSEQNKAAFAALRRAIHEDYSYRDRKEIDWAREFAERQSKFENARTANEFARLTAHLLRLAEDAHVWIEAGDVRIGTTANSASPNCNLQLLQRVVPNWKEHPGGVITGRFDDDAGDMGYVLFSQCTKEQAAGLDTALEELKDTQGLILDARPNGGGDENAARRVAGRFIEKRVCYSKSRLRQDGNWTGPFDRVVEPRAKKAAWRYTKPVVVLIGPKVASSAESFVLMMKHGAAAKLIGDATQGSSGRPLPHQLGNGVTVHLPSWEDQLPDGTILEGRGVQPDIAVQTTLRDLERSDAVLEAAMKVLQGSYAPVNLSTP